MNRSMQALHYTGKTNDNINEVFFISSSIKDIETILQTLDQEQLVYIIDSQSSGLSQIADVLAGKNDYDAVHILSHGSSGQLQLGNSTLNSENLDLYANDLESIKGSLSPDADILLYGCNVAEGEQGEAFVTKLSQMTGADVAASDDLTGTASSDGNWQLEYHTGYIESGSLENSYLIENYHYTLALPSNGNQDVTPTTVPGNFIPGFTLSLDTSSGTVNYHTNDPAGLYFKDTNIANNVQFTVAADGTNLGSFDLTAMDWNKYNVAGGFNFTVTGTKLNNSTVQATFSTAEGSTTYSTPNFSSFTGITQFVVVIDPLDDNTADQNTFDFFTIANATAPSSNNAPVITLPSAPAVSEDATAVAIADSIQIADADAGDTQTVTLTITGGTANLVTTTGLTGLSGNGSASISFSGSLTDVNNALDSLTFTPTANLNGTNAGAIRIQTNDGNGGTDDKTVTFNITAVNDAPTQTGAVPTSFSFTEDTAGNFDLSGMTLADVDGDATVVLTLTATEGTFTASSGGGVAIGGSTTGTLTLTGTAANIDSYINTASNIQYTGAANDNGSPAATVDIKINDGAGSGDIDLNATDSNINISAVNDAPVLSGTPTLAQFEDAPATAMNLSGVSLADVDTTGDITITLSVADTSAALSATATGTINNVDVTQVNAYTITLVGTVSELNSYLGSQGATNITYATSANKSGNDTLSIIANDGSSNSNSLTPTITITGVNDEPTATATGDNGSAAGAGAAVSVFSSATISAVETGQNIASLTFTVSGLADSSNEKLIIDGSTVDLMTTVGSTNATGGNIAYAVTYSAGTATVVITGAAGAAAANTVFQTALNGMTYQNTLGGVTTGNRVFTLTEVKDAGGTANSGDDTLAVSITSTINVVNGDTPSATNATKAATEDTPFTMTTSEIVLVQEANAVDALEYITISSVSGGTLALTGSPTAGTATDSSTLATAGALTAGSKINIADLTLIQFTPTANSTSSGSVVYTVTDAGGDVSASATLTVNLAAVEDAPTLTGVTTTITAIEDTATNLITGSPVFADVDTTADVVATLTATDTAAVLTATSSGGVVVGNSGTNAITLTGTAAEINSFLATASNITYTGSSNNVTTDTVVISVNDGEGGTSANATTITVNFTPVNDAPTVSATGTGGNAINGAATDLFNSTAIDVAVPDTGDLVKSVTFTVSGLKDSADEKINIDGTAVTLTNATSGTTTGNSLGYAVSVTGTTATVTLTHAGIAEATVEAILNAMTYENTSGTFTEGARVITLTEVKDNGGTANSGNDTWSTGGIASTVTVVDGTKPTATSYTDSVNEDTAVSLSATELPTVRDAGNQTLEYITINTSTVVGGVLSLDSAGTAGTSTVGGVQYDTTAGNLSGTVNINIADIGKLKFTPTTNLAGTGAASFNWKVTDEGGHSSPDATYTLDITAVNDAPSLIGQGENPFFFSGTQATNLFRNAQINTVESGQSIKQLVLTISNVTDTAKEFLVVNGTDVDLTSNASTNITTGGYTVTVVTGVPTTVTIDTSAGNNTVTDIQNLIHSLKYRNDATTLTEASRVVFLTTIQDDGGIANGGADTTTGSILVSTVTANNNTLPTGTNKSLTLNEDSTYTLQVADFGFNDSDVNDSLSTMKITALPALGSLSLDGNAISLNAEITKTQLDAGQLKYTPVANANGSNYSSFTFQVSDGKAYATNSNTLTLSVTPVNDNPTGSVTISGNATQGETLTASHTLTDADGLGTISYQWLRDGGGIDGATGDSYTLTQTDVGQQISVKANYTDLQGTAETQTSSATTTVANVNDSPTSNVSISGIAKQGEILTASHTLADVDGLGTVSYQWLRDGQAIQGATGDNYTLIQADVGAVISVQAAYTDQQGTNESVIFGTTALVAPLQKP
ncbi:Cadherin-like, partial [Oceanospirillum multiglobuliferum]